MATSNAIIIVTLQYIHSSEIKQSESKAVQRRTMLSKKKRQEKCEVDIA